MSKMTLERFAWITAYFKHFDGEPRSRVLEALGVHQGEFDDGTRENNQRLSQSLAKGDHELAKQFAAELALAQSKLARDKPTLDDVRVTYAKSTMGAAATAAPTNPDETVMQRAYLPDVVMPFERADAPKQRPASLAAPVAPPPADDGSGTVMAPSPFAPKAPLPFDTPGKPPGSFDPDQTLPLPAPKKTR